MNRFDEKSARLILILIAICLVFVIVVWNAFKYLPSEDYQAQSTKNEVVVPSDEDANAEQPEESKGSEEEISNEEEVSQKNQDSELRKEKYSKSEKSDIDKANSESLESVDNNDSKSEIKAETPESILGNALNLKLSKQYTQAIAEYKRAAELSSSKQVKAICYEEISDIYAISRRYGTALSYAQQAYNISPSSSRELLLARLYYKTGDIDKATRRVNNILQRDFELENK